MDKLFSIELLEEPLKVRYQASTEDMQLADLRCLRKVIAANIEQLRSTLHGVSAEIAKLEMLDTSARTKVRRLSRRQDIAKRSS